MGFIDALVERPIKLSDIAFVGEMDFDSILETIHSQFSNYMNSSLDKNNYVEQFYSQWKRSLDIAEEDLDQRDFLIEELNSLMYKFISYMNDLFNKSLTISIPMIESGDLDIERIEIILKELYEFFILNSRENFKKVISKDVVKRVDYIEDEEKLFNMVERLVIENDPLIINITPMDFIKNTENNNIYELFDNNEVVGNFLRRYSPLLYMNEDFKIELLTNIVMILQLEEELKNGTKENASINTDQNLLLR